MFSKAKRTAALAIAGLTLSGCLLTAAFAAPPKSKKPPKKSDKVDTALIAKGKKVYDANACKACHAVKGEGGKSAPDLTKIGATRSAQWLSDKVADPKKSNPKSTMPGYKSQIKGADLKAIGAYLKSLK